MTSINLDQQSLTGTKEQKWVSVYYISCYDNDKTWTRYFLVN